MTYLIYIGVIGIAYIIWHIIKYIINKLFPNFYKKNEKKFESKRINDLENYDKNQKETGSYKTIIGLIIFFIMLATIENFHRKNQKLEKHISSIKQYKTKNNYEENQKLKKIIEKLEVTSYFKDYLEIKTKYEKMQEENKMMKVFIKENKKETKFY